MPKKLESTGKRAYDAESRRARAEQERLQSRRKVLAAARKRFLADGYATTKMTDIAYEAGVALATVYRSAPSKAGLVLLLMEQAVTGTEPVGAVDQPMTFTNRERPQYPRIANETDPHRQLRMITDITTDILERVAPLWSVFTDAAAVDETAAEALKATLARRATAFEVVLGLLPPDQLRESVHESADTLWALSSPAMYLMVRSGRGWSRRQYRDWLHRTLAVVLLKSPPDALTPPDHASG